MNNQKDKKEINRRSFLHSAAAAGAGMVLSPMVVDRAGGAAKADDINIALLGCGAQGQVLMNACRNIPGIRFKAVCDIWTAYNQRRVSRLLARYGHEHNTYVDYKEMLDKEKGVLDAVIVATPDFWHADHTVASLKAGLNVYCEKEMSNTLEGAKRMVQAAKESGKLLQIGHQRRSNPRYIHCYDKYIKSAKLLGDLGWPKKYPLEQAALDKYGFKSMQQFRNWRWYKGLGGGPIVDLGSHQIDIYSWFLGTNPKSVMASGGVDYWKGHEWYDTVMVIYEYETKEGTVRAFYQTITTNSSQGYFESFMGDEGTLSISEASARGSLFREAAAPDWDKWIKMGYISEPPKKEEAESEAVLDVRETVPVSEYKIPVTMDKPYHQPHLENFFDAVRGKAKLNCPAEIGYETAVTVLKVNEAVAAAKKLDFKEDEFTV
ncbi:MAG: Gfo/Idh/MocA family oxidoreductase [Planctomycetota bacterium]|jgi:predicted dehydrogenase